MGPIVWDEEGAEAHFEHIEDSSEHQDARPAGVNRHRWCNLIAIGRAIENDRSERFAYSLCDNRA